MSSLRQNNLAESFFNTIYIFSHFRLINYSQSLSGNFYRLLFNLLRLVFKLKSTLREATANHTFLV